MNLKRIFTALLTLPGIGGVLYTASVFTQTLGDMRGVKKLIISLRSASCFLLLV